MMKPASTDAFPREPCGCPTQTWKFPFRCPPHAWQDGRLSMPGPSAAERHPEWYRDNCCPFCWRVNPYGLACLHVEHCDLCGVRSCNSHSQATYLLGVICPRTINPRTKVGRAFLKALNFVVRQVDDAAVAD